MKKKFIVGLMAVMLVVALLVFAMPVMSPDTDTGVAGGSPAAVTADLAVMDSEALIVENSAPAPAPIAGEASMWLALSAILVTIAVASRRRLYKLFYLTTLCLRSPSGNPASAMGTGGSNKFILPASA